MLPFLPDEILTIIISFLDCREEDDEEDDENEDVGQPPAANERSIIDGLYDPLFWPPRQTRFEDLLSFSLCSRRFHRIGLPLLYAEFETRPQTFGSCHKLHPIAVARGDLIRKLHFYQEELADTVDAIVSRCPNLTHLRLTLDAVPIQSLATLPLTHLHLHNCEDSVVPPLPHTLRLLVLEKFTQGSFRITHKLKLPALRGITLISCDASEDVQSLLDNVMSDLQTLTICEWDIQDNLPTSDLIDIALQRAELSLAKLQLVLQNCRRSPDLRLLSRFPLLSTLLYCIGAPDDSILHLAALLPPTLTSIQLLGIPSIAALLRLLEAFEQSHFIPALSQFPVLQCDVSTLDVPAEVWKQVATTEQGLLARGLEVPKSSWLSWGND